MIIHSTTNRHQELRNRYQELRDRHQKLKNRHQELRSIRDRVDGISGQDIVLGTKKL